MTRPRWMALFFALGSTCFLVGPLPGYVQLVGERADAITFFVGSILFTAGGAMQSWLAWDGMAVGRGRRTRGVVVRDRPVRRDAVLQCHDLSGDARRADELRLRQARLAARLARVDLLPRLGRDRLRCIVAPRMAWMVAGAGERRMVAAGRQSARLHLLRHLRRRGLRRAVVRLDARPRRGELEHIAGRGVLSRLRARHTAPGELEQSCRVGDWLARIDRRPGARRRAERVRSRRPRLRYRQDRAHDVQETPAVHPGRLPSPTTASRSAS